jgi:hypothetical protein
MRQQYLNSIHAIAAVTSVLMAMVWGCGYEANVRAHEAEKATVKGAPRPL